MKLLKVEFCLLIMTFRLRGGSFEVLLRPLWIFLALIMFLRGVFCIGIGQLLDFPFNG